MVTIDLSAFNYNQLIEVTFGSGLESIYTDAFRFNQLPSVVIPANVIYLGWYAFSGNEELTIATVYGTNVTLEPSVFPPNQPGFKLYGYTGSTVLEWVDGYPNIEFVSIDVTVVTLEADEESPRPLDTQVTFMADATGAILPTTCSGSKTRTVCGR